MSQSLLDETRKAASLLLDYIKEEKNILIISHMDADGLAAAGIIGSSLARANANFCIRIERRFDEKVMKDMASDKDCLTILADMGSGYLDILSDIVKDKHLIILDHHQPIEKESETFIHVNPHFHGIDGSRDISASGIAYLVAKALSEKNVDLAYLGVVGALGDLQDKYNSRSLGGVNELIIKEAIKAGYLQIETDLLLFGRETRPIYKALAYTTTPFIPGISGEEDKSLAFLMDLGVKLKEDERWRALRDLSKEEKQKIFSALTEYLVSKGLKSDVAMSLLGTVYVLNREEPWTPLRDAREFALLLNATGRTGKAGLGVAICMGDRGKSLEEANRSLEEYKQTITKYFKWLEENPDCLEERENIYVLHGEQVIDEKVISAISSILSTSLPKIEKPLIAYSTIPEEKIIKISARTVDAMTLKGFNIGEVIRLAAEKCFGKGGGHNIAAGAQIPDAQKDDFLKYVNELVKNHLQRLKDDGS
jgi:RecJ-like exonuclease